MRSKLKPVRIIPPLTDAELDSRRGGPGTSELYFDGAGEQVPAVTSDTLRRADEALRWHEKRAKGQAS